MLLLGRLTVPVEPRMLSIRPFQPRLPARVTTNAGTPILAKKKPWTNPVPAPVARANISARYWLTPLFTDSTANTAAARPDTEPTDRSISPSSSTKTMPKAIMPVPTICWERLDRFCADRNVLFRRRTRSR